MGSLRKAGKKRHSQPYSKGQLNRLIDDLCNPFYKTDKSFVLVDGLLHGLVERNPPQSALKFLRYSLPAITSQVKTLSDLYKLQHVKGDR